MKILFTIWYSIIHITNYDEQTSHSLSNVNFSDFTPTFPDMLGIFAHERLIDAANNYTQLYFTIQNGSKKTN